MVSDCVVLIDHQRCELEFESDVINESTVVALAAGSICELLNFPLI